jgi:hypothetical protein
MVDVLMTASIISAVGWIAKGRSYYEAALAEPVRAADEAEPDANECEDMIHVAAAVYKSKTGNYPPKSDIPLYSRFTRSCATVFHEYKGGPLQAADSAVP